MLIRHANTNNLKDLSIEIPLGKFITVTGVSGAGKSSLVFGVVAEVEVTPFQCGDLYGYFF